MSATRSRALLDELARLEALRDPAKTAGLRQFRRFIVRGDAELHPMEPTQLSRQPIEVKLRDVARGGLGCVSTVRVPAGSSWRVVFFHRGYPIGEQAVIIRHCRQISEGVFLIGGQFCINPGLMALLGVEPSQIAESDGDGQGGTQARSFLPPSEVA